MPVAIPRMNDPCCPLCGYSLKQFQINMAHYVTMCENVECPFPLDQPQVENFINMEEGALTALLDEHKVNEPLPQATPPSFLSDIEQLFNDEDDNSDTMTPMDTPPVEMSLFDGLDDMLPYDTKVDPFQENAELDQLLGV
ncbi:hypothetical protein K492DRAFT_235702 [Lichtheimia hyalospora FSU 10163]|nr:hypothetical protein K492DRAFT_235702 [Lichtheimia hyalospora FSU 10163]